VTGGSAAELEAARRGVFARAAVDGLPGDTAQAYFQPGPAAGFVAVAASIRGRVTFFESKLEVPPIAGPFDLVFADLPADALSVVWSGPPGRSLPAHLRPGGLLIAPHWPRPDLPVAGFRRAADGIFVRAA
jgi:hypothetical protein